MKRGTVILVSALAGLTAHAQPAQVFPNIKSADLNGRSLSLPDDFPAPLSLVFVAFEMRQQADLDSWRPFVEPAQR
jgi:parvulin-like peptidyl-prolyl isomerase